MCTDCGCGERQAPDHAHDHDHSHDGHHAHDHDHSGPSRTLTIQRKVLAHNDDLAADLRARFAEHGVFVVNVVSSPGSGKTELLQRTMTELQPELRVAAVTGDLATENDASRLAESGAPVRQILTGTMCHLEADMVADAIERWNLTELDVLFIENVGNMVCPSGFDLGEDLRVMLVATTEGEDKPLKYPTLTMSADVAVISKVDLAEPVECDVELLTKNLDEVRPGIPILETSARRGTGVAEWIELLRDRVAAKAGAPA
ncbi:MAG: hydrogenase nickel incorporation protein HypB [Ilumatobacteraceae bacterium]